MRRLLSISVSICLCFAAFALTGCDEVECDPCPVDVDGNSVCQVFEGVYFGSMIGQGGTCTDQEDVLTGDLRVTARKIVSAGNDPTKIEIELMDEDGNWTIFTGVICNTEDTESPKAYPFNVNYSMLEEEEGFQLNNTLAGVFYEADQDEGLPIRIDASYTVSLTVTDEPDMGCNMSAHLTAEP